MTFKSEVVGQEKPAREVSPAVRTAVGICAIAGVSLLFVYWSSGQALEAAEMPEFMVRNDLAADRKSAAAVLELGQRQEQEREERARIEEQAKTAAAQPLADAGQLSSQTGAVAKVYAAVGENAPNDWTPRPVEGVSDALGEPGAADPATLTPAQRLELEEAQMREGVRQHLGRVQQQRMQARETQLAQGSSSVREPSSTSGARGASRSADPSEADEQEKISGLHALQNQLLKQSADQVKSRSEGGSLGALGALTSLGSLGGGASALGGTMGESGNANRSKEKLDFFMHGGDQLRPGVLTASVQPAQSPCTLHMGAFIPGALLTAIHSESPGQITGMVTENVYDSISQRNLLIPMGTKIVGTYSGAIGLGDERVQIAAVRLNFRNGSTLDLGGMMLADSEGRAGLHDKVNRHLWQRVVAFLLNTSAAVGLQATRPASPFGVEGALHRGVGEAVLQTANQMTQQASQIPPTLEIRQGERLVITLSKDIVFPGPYEDGITQRRDRRRPAGTTRTLDGLTTSLR